MSQMTNLLLVDDRPENLLALESVLEEPSRNIFKANSGQEALSLLLEREFALVLMDVQMPIMDGFETAELMRSNMRTKEIPIVFITALNKESRFVFRGFETGACDYIFKPVDPDILRSKVNVFLELHRQKEELARSQERFRSLIESAPVGIVTINRSGTIQTFNKAAEHIFGYSAKEIMGKPIKPLIPYLGSSESQHFINRLLEGGDDLATPRELQGLRSDGTAFFLKLVLDHSTVNGDDVFTGVIEDITERKRAEEELRLSKEILDNLAEGVDLVSSSDATIVYTNPRFERMFGYAKGEMLGQHVSIVNAENSEETAKSIMKELHERNIWRGEVNNRRKDGSTFWSRANVTTFQHSRWGAVWVAVHEDITLSKQKEEELRKAKELAESATNAKSRFLATMSHEIRTPMNGVIGMTNLLMDTNLSHEQREYVGIARSSGEVLMDIINDILDFSKIEAGKLDLDKIDFDLRSIVESVGGILAPKAREKAIQLSIFIHHCVPTRVCGDPGRLRQILINLLNNAIKFTDFGEVSLRCSHKKGQPASHILFEVIDTGIGIPENRQTRLFQPFAQLDTSSTRKFGGTGLGLAICKELVEAMGGEIMVHSAADKGSSFSFTVPFEAARESGSIQVGISPMNKAPVMVLHPSPKQREIFVEQLIALNCTPVEAESEQQALSIIETGDVRALLVLHQEGKFNGQELVEKWSRSKTKRVPILLITDVPSRGDSARMMALDIEAYLPQPVKSAQLLDVLLGILVPERSAAAKSKNLKNARTGEATILLVEDNVVNQKVAMRLLEKGGYKCHVAEHGLEALEALESETYDLILMDCQMPKMDGFEATRKIRLSEKHKHIPIIALTAGALKGDKEKCFAAGMNDYMSKPFKNAEFYNMLNKYLDKDA